MNVLTLSALSALAVSAMSSEDNTAAAKNAAATVGDSCWAFARAAAADHSKPATLDAYLFMVRATCGAAREKARPDAKRWTALASACSTIVSAVTYGVTVDGATKATVSKGIKAAKAAAIASARAALFEANPDIRAALSPEAAAAQAAAEMAQMVKEFAALKAENEALKAAATVDA